MPANCALTAVHICAPYQSAGIWEISIPLKAKGLQSKPYIANWSLVLQIQPGLQLKMYYKIIKTYYILSLKILHSCTDRKA